MRNSKLKTKIDALTDIIYDHPNRVFIARDFYNLALAYFPGRKVFRNSRDVSDTLTYCNVSIIGKRARCKLYKCLTFLEQKR